MEQISSLFFILSIQYIHKWYNNEKLILVFCNLLIILIYWLVTLQITVMWCCVWEVHLFKVYTRVGENIWLQIYEPLLVLTSKYTRHHSVPTFF